MPATRGTLTFGWEQANDAPGRPIALELTFRAPDAVPDESPRLPLNVGLAIDRSGSMQGEKIYSARQAAVGVLEALKDGERFAAAAFDTHVFDVSDSVRLNDNMRAHIRRKIESLVAGSSTALFDGFTRTAELVALGGEPADAESWIIILSDGMGNHGLVDPASMRRHASEIAERGIRTISIGIGEDYQADQLTALAEGGSGDFHHASEPGQIVEIVLGELRALRSIGARGLRINVQPHGAERWRLIGGDARRQANGRIEARYDRVSNGRETRAVVLLWPGSGDRVAIDASWMDRDQQQCWIQLDVTREGAPARRDVELATRAARLWHAQIIAKSLELNERHQYDQAEEWLQRSRRDFLAYVDGLPGMSELIDTLVRVEDRVGSVWETTSHRETYVMARQIQQGKSDLRRVKLDGFAAALRSDKK